MLKFTNITNQKRIIIYFVLAIVIPSISMGVLAFRGIKNDQALYEKESRRNAIEAGNQIIRSTEQILKNQENEFRNIVTNTNPPTEAYFTDSLIESFVNKYPTISGISFLTENNLYTLSNSFHFYPNSYFRDIELMPDKTNYEFKVGWALEYQKQQYKKAIDFYKAIFENHPEQSYQVIALISIARLHKKLGDGEAAIEYYDKLRVEFGRFYLNKKLPASLVANSEIAKLQYDIGNIQEAFNRHVLLQEELIEKKWDLDESTYSFFVDLSKAFLNDQMPSKQNRFNSQVNLLDSIIQVQRDIQQKTRNLHSVNQRIWEINKNIHLKFPPNSNNHWIENIDGNDHIISSLRLNQDTSWFIITNSKSYYDNILFPILEEQTATSSWSWNLKNCKNTSFNSSTKVYEGLDVIELGFPSDMPACTLQAYSKPPTFFQTFFQSGQGFYFYLFLFLGAILLSGSYFVLNSVNRELQLTKMKSDFIATVSHEFKSPLTAIRQIAEMLQSDRVPLEKKNKYYSVMVQQSTRLSRLIDNVLDFSSMEQNKKRYVFEKNDLAVIVQNTVNLYQQRISNQEFTFNMNIEPNLPYIKIDGKAIEQVIINLLDNAVKYSGNSKKVLIGCEIENGSIITYVQDFGIGIAKNDHDKIFDRFFRVSNKMTYKFKGSGIGLSLSKEIIEVHGGRIMVESALGKGSTFRFYLPSESNFQ